MELTVNRATENGSYATHYILTWTKPHVFSHVMGAIHYKSSNKIDIVMPQGNTVRIDARDDSITAIKEELGVQ